MSMRRTNRGSSSKSPARIAFLRDKAIKLQQQVKSSIFCARQRQESRLTWWQTAFRTPLVGFYGWVRSRCSSLWAAMMTIMGLSRSSRLAPRASSIKATQKYRQSFMRSMLHAENLEQRQLLAADLTLVSPAATYVNNPAGADTALTNSPAVTLSGSATPGPGFAVVIDSNNDGLFTLGETVANVNGLGQWGAGFTLAAPSTTVSFFEVTTPTTVGDGPGPAGIEDSVVITLDQVAPTAAVAITAITDDTGTNTSDFKTSDNSLTVSGTNDALGAGEKIQVRVNTGVWVDATVLSSTTWNYADPANHTVDFTYNVRVIDLATNVGNTASQLVVIDNASPVFTSAATRTVNENVTVNTSVTGGPTQATDANGPVSYTETGVGDGASVFSINSSTGQITVDGALDFETKSSYTYEVQATDAVGNFSTQNITINVNDLAEDFVFPSSAAFPPGGATLVRIGAKLHLRATVSPFADLVAPHQMSNVQNIIIDGAAGTNDTLTIDFSGGNPLPAAPFSLVFNGGVGGTDKLVVKGNGQTAVYTPSTTTFGNGQILVSGSTINFTGLEPVDITGMASVTVASPVATTNSLVLNSGTDSATSTQPAIVVTGLTNGVAIEAAHLWNNGTVIIDTSATTGGANINTITVSSALTNAHANGNLELKTNSNGSVAVNSAVTVSGNLIVTSPNATLAANLTALALSGTATAIQVNNGAEIQDGVDIASTAAAAIVSVQAGAFVYVGDVDTTGANKAITLRPSGLTIGTVAITGNLKMNAGDTLAIQFTGASNDKLTVVGTVDLGGASLALTNLGAVPPFAIPSTALTIIDNNLADTNGTFLGLPEGSLLLANFQLFKISYIGTDGNNVTLKPASLTIDANDTPPREGGPLVNGQFTVFLTEPVVGDTVVNYTVGTGANQAVPAALAGGPVGNPNDYQTLPGSVTILNGQTSAVIDVIVFDDLLSEDVTLERVEVTLTSITGVGVLAAPITPASAITPAPAVAPIGQLADVVAIIDNDPSLITLTSPDNAINPEGSTSPLVVAGDTASYRISLTASSTSTIVNVNLGGSASRPTNSGFLSTTTGSTALPGATDYQLALSSGALIRFSGAPTGSNAQISIPAGVTEVNIVVTPASDNMVEITETIVLTLNSVVAGGLPTIGSPAAQTINITDDDAAVVTLEPSPTSDLAGNDPNSIPSATSPYNVAQDAGYVVQLSNPSSSDTLITYTVSAPQALGQQLFFENFSSGSLPSTITQVGGVGGAVDVFNFGTVPAPDQQLRLRKTGTAAMTSPNRATFTVDLSPAKLSGGAVLTFNMQVNTPSSIIAPLPATFTTSNENSEPDFNGLAISSNGTNWLRLANFNAGPNSINLEHFLYSNGLEPGVFQIRFYQFESSTGAGSENRGLSFDNINVVLGDYEAFPGVAKNAGVVSGTQTGTVTVLAGNTQAIIPVRVINDLVVEGTESVTVTLSALPSSANTNVTVTPNSVFRTRTATITDSDTALVTITNAGNGNELGLSGTPNTPINGKFNVSLTNAHGLPMRSDTSTKVPFEVELTPPPGASPGATYGSLADYTLSGTNVTITKTPTLSDPSIKGFIIIPAGATQGVIDVIVNQDTDVEDDEWVNIKLLNPLVGDADPDITSSSVIASVAIQDEDKALIRIDGLTNGREGVIPTNGAFIVDLVRSLDGTTTLQPIQSVVSNVDTVVFYTVVAGVNPATPGLVAGSPSDYRTLTGSVTITAGQTFALIPVEVFDDFDLEPTETVTITLTSKTGDSSVLIHQNQKTDFIEIEDNDTLSVKVRREVTNSGTISSATRASGIVTLTTVAGHTFVKGQTIEVSGATPASFNGTFLIISTATNTITYSQAGANDTTSVGGSLLTYDAAEPNKDGEFTIYLDGTASIITNYQAALPAGAAGNVVVTYTMSGLASNGVDYTSLNGTATISAKTTTAVTIAIDVIDDLFFDPNESVTITLTGVTTQAPLGLSGTGVVADNTPASIVIADNEIGDVFIASFIGARESNTNGEITFQLPDRSPFNTIVTYDVTPSGAAPIATQGSDHNLFSGAVTFTANQTIAKVVVPVLNDTILEDTEFIPVKITGFAVGGNGGGFGFNPATSLVPIFSDQTVDIVAVQNGVEGGVVSPFFTIGMQAPSTAATIVTYQVVSAVGDAQSPSDYTSLPLTATIPIGATTVNVAVTVADDSTIEATENLTIRLLTVTNDDDPDIRIGAAVPTPVATEGSVNAVNKQLTNNQATITTAQAHGLSVGASVTIALSPADPVFDGTYTITAVTATTIRYNRTFSFDLPLSTTGGTVASVDAAGSLPATATVTNGSFGLTTINGVLGTSDEDMYLIRIDNPAAFVATASGLDAQLFLFKADGTGVIADDDSGPGLNPQITLSALATLPAPGLYYLAISGFNNNPTSGGNPIWLSPEVNSAPNGVGALGVVDGWQGGGFSGSYSISLTGASFAGYDAKATLAIADNDRGYIQVTGTKGTEGGDPVKFTLTQSAASSTDTVIRYTLSSVGVAGDPTYANPNTPAAGRDITLNYTTYTATIGAGSTSVTVTVPVVDDMLVEGDLETVVLNLQSIISSDPNIKLGTVDGPTLTFQNGLNGYSSTFDTYISQANNDTNFGGSPTISVETDSLTLFGSTAQNQGLVRFDNIFGPNVIPVGSSISSATLDFDTALNATSISMYRMLVAWNAATVKWNNSFGNDGIQPLDFEARSVPTNTGFSATSTRDVLSDIQAWAANPADNNGWAILSNGTTLLDLWVAYSSENALAVRPELVITVSTSASVVICDNDEATVNISSVIAGTEPGGPLTGPGSTAGIANSAKAIISINKASSTDTYVTYTITNGTATGGGIDYIAPTTTQIATILAGNTSTTVLIEVTDDFTVEGTENVVVTLGSVLYSSTSAITTAARAGTLVTLTVPAHNFVVGETVNVAGLGGAFAGLNGTHTVSAVTATTIQFNAGSGTLAETAVVGSVSFAGTDPQITLGTTTTQNVPINDNDIGVLTIAAFDGFEKNPTAVTFKAKTGGAGGVATLTSPGHNLTVGQTLTVAGVGAPFDGTFVITAVGTGPDTVSYALPGNPAIGNMASTGGTVTAGPVNGKFVITTDFASATATVIPYQIIVTVPPNMPLSEATQGAGNDYVLKDGTTTLTGMVTLPPLVTSVEVTINVFEDFINEGNETVTMKLVPPTGLLSIAASPSDQATAIIHDDDNLKVSVVATDNMVIEGADAGIDDGLLTIGLNYASDSDIRVVYTVSTGGTAATPGAASPIYTNGNDYAALPGTGSAVTKTIVIPAGSTQFKLPVEVYNDYFDENDETVTVTLNSFSRFEPGTTTNSNNTNSMLDGTKLTDFVTIKDAIFDVTIVRNDSPGKEPGFPSPIPGGLNGQFIVFITNPLPQDLIVTVQDTTLAGPGKAILGTDYTYSGSSNPTQLVTILAGNTSAPLTVTVIDDLLSEGTETVDVQVVGLSSMPNFALPGAPVVPPVRIPLGSLAIGSPSSAQVEIQDNDKLNVTITAENGVDKAGPSPSAKTDGKFIFDQGFNSPYWTVITYVVDTTGANNATEGSDYSLPSPKQVTIPAGVSTAAVTLNVIGDSIVEGDEFVKLKITNIATFEDNLGVIGAAYSIPSMGINNTGTATITDEDTAEVKFSTVNNASETTGVGSFTVELTNPSSSTTVVAYTVSGGTATVGAGNDYTHAPLGSTNGSVTLTAGQTQAFILVSVLDDDIVEANPETVQLTLSSPPLSPTDPQISISTTMQSATMNIADNDVARVTVVKTADAKEGVATPGNFRFNLVDAQTALVSKTVDQIVTVTYEVTGTAKGGAANSTSVNGPDYLTLSGTLNIPIGSTQVDLPVSVFDDNFVENTENVSVRITSVTSASRAVSPNTAIAAVSSRSLTSNVVTITTAGNHGFSPLQFVNIAIGGAFSGTFNGVYQIVGVPTPNTFTYAKTNANIPSASVSGTAALSAPAFDVTARAESGAGNTTATLTTLLPHNFTMGDTIVVAIDDAGYNGTFVALAGTTGSTIVYNKGTGAGGNGSAVGNVTLAGVPAAVVTGQLTSNVVTLTTTKPHGFLPGQIVKVAIGDPVFDGTFVLITASGSTMTYSKLSGNATYSLTGTPIVSSLSNATVLIEDNDQATLSLSGGSFKEGNKIFDLATDGSAGKGAILTLTLDKAFDVDTTWDVSYFNPTLRITTTVAERNSNVVTLTLASTHAYSVGQTIVVAGTTGLDGTYKVTAVPSANSISFEHVGADGLIGGLTVGTTSLRSVAKAGSANVNNEAGNDYDSTPDQIVFLAGQTTKTFKVDFNEEDSAVLGPNFANLVEDDEIFGTKVAPDMLGPNGGTLAALATYAYDASTTSQVTIENDDTATYKIANKSETEGGIISVAPVTGTMSLTGNVVTLAIAAHGVSAGDTFEFSQTPANSIFDGRFIALPSTTVNELKYAKVNADVGSAPIVAGSLTTYTPNLLNFTVSVDNPVDMPINVLVNYTDGAGVLGAKGNSYMLLIPVGTDYNNDPGAAAFLANDDLLYVNNKTVSVRITPDLIVEGGTTANPGSETFTAVTSINPNSFTVIPQGARLLVNGSPATGTITDDDSALIIFSLVDGLAAEPNPVDNGQYKIHQTNPSSVDTVIKLQIATGGILNATQGVDYELRVGGNLVTDRITIPAGQTEVLLDVVVLPDGVLEDDEFVNLSLDSFISRDPNVNFQFGPSQVLTVRIDNTNSTLLSVVKTKDGKEPGNPADDGLFTLSLSQTSDTQTIVYYHVLIPTEPGFVAPAATPGAGLDYIALSGTATIPAFTLSTTVLVDVLNDFVPNEGTEHVTIMLDSFVGSAQIAINPLQNIATVDITEGGGLYISIDVLNSDLIAREQGEEIGFFRIQLTDGAGNRVTVPAGNSVSVVFDITTGSTASIADLQVNIPNTVVIPAGASEALVQVKPADDVLVEGTEKLKLTIQSATPLNTSSLGPIALGSLASPALSISNDVDIIDNDFGSVSAVQVNGGASQRSNLKTVTVNFDAPVTLLSGAFTVQKRRDTNVGPEVVDTVPASSVIVTLSPSGLVATLTFVPSSSPTSLIDMAGSLKTGNYQVTIDPSKVLTAGATPIISKPSDPTGGDMVFGNLAADNMFRLYGDADGDGDVDMTDYFVHYLPAFGSVSVDSAYESFLDAEGDGDIDFTDYFTYFLSNFGTNRPGGF